MSIFIDPQVRRNVGRLDIPFNELGLDRFGVSRDYLVRWFSPLAYMYRHYLKVTAFGLEHVPERGRGLLIGNHSGGVGADAAMMPTSLILNDANPRLAHGMADYFFQRWPFVSTLTSRIGALTGLPEHAEQLMDAERLLLVFPEGARGAGKLYRDRYKLVRFGTGFMRLALKKRAPIIPFAFVGGEETFPTLFRLDGLAKALGAPILPIAPQLLMLPLPVSCQIYFGEPMRFEGTGDEPDEVIQVHVEKVKDSIAALIERGLAARPSAFTMERVTEAPELADGPGA